MFRGPFIVSIFWYISNKMQRYTVSLYLDYMFQVESPLIIRSTQLYLQRLVLVKPLLLPAAIAAGSSNVLTDTVVCAPDDGWRYHPKHVEHFPNINKLWNVASCWIYISICCIFMHRPWGWPCCRDVVSDKRLFIIDCADFRIKAIIRN